MRPVPDNAGKRLIPHVIDDLANNEPSCVLYEVAVGKNVADGFLKVTCESYANAINRTAWLLEKWLGKGKTFDTIGYIGPGK
jgi:hypothetical protein